MLSPSRILAISLACSLLGASSFATAQIVTPPPATNPNPENEIPKVAPPPQQPPAQAPVTARPTRATPVREPLPDLPWKDWDKDDKGKPLPLTEPLELAALRRNPLVTPDTLAKIDAYLPERRQSIQRIVIDNLDLVEKIDDGLFERTNFAEKGGVSQVVAATKPLSIPSLPTELKNRQIIDDKAFGFNAKITTAFTKADAPARTPDADATVKQAENMRILGHIYKQAVNEQMWVYDQLLVAAAPVVNVTAGATPADTKAAVKAALAKLSIDERKEALRKAAGQSK